MTQFFRIQLECRPRGARKWEETSHTTSHLPSAFVMIEEQIKLHPEQEWRFVGEIVTADENGKEVR